MKVNYISKKSDFLKSSSSLVVVAPENFFNKKSPINTLIPEDIVSFMKKGAGKFSAGEYGKTTKSFIDHQKVNSVTYVSLPQKVSRGNSPTRKFFTDRLLLSAVTGDKVAVLFVVDDNSHADAAVASIARLKRTVTYKTENGKVKKKETSKPVISLMVANSKTGSIVNVSENSKKLVDSISWCMSLVDRAPTELNPEAFAKEIKSKYSKLASVKVTEIKGKDLVKHKLGGVWSVGKAAVNAPRLVALHYKPKGANKTVAIVGKGVTYDSGGLNLKISGSMSGMKTDMGGSAAVVSAFDHLVKTKCKNEIIAVVGLVENAISAESYKPDDIVYMHSGKTVEINNTDAEGRLVLGDCVSWVARKYAPSILIDAATLTGAQLVATGMNHAAVVSNDDNLEERACKVGKETGDLVWPLVFAPDILRNEFSSAIADMKNSVKNRMNAQSSCAANFIYAHIEDIPKMKWLHIDLAGPASNGDNLGTGYGVNLISKLCQ